MPGDEAYALAETPSTPSRLLAATVRLIGQQGVDAVSIRAINAEAASNMAATHYHFGSKEALVAAALQRHMDPLATERLEMLAPLERRTRPLVPAVAEVLVVPLARLAEGGDGRDYVRFLAALDRAGDPWRGLLGAAFAPQWERFGPVLAKAMPGVPEGLRNFRLSVAGTAILGVLADPARYQGLPGRQLRDGAVRAALVETVDSILAGPKSRARRRST